MGFGVLRKLCWGGRPNKRLLFLTLCVLTGVFIYRVIAVVNKEAVALPSSVIPLLSYGKLDERSSRVGTKKPKSSYKTILAWTTKSGKSKWIPNSLRNLACEVNSCKITEDRSKYPESHAVVLHAKDVDVNDLPPENDHRGTETGSGTGNGRKIWVLLNHEPPPQTPRHILAFLSSRIDWTVSYRRDSTIFAPIYDLRPISGSTSFPVTTPPPVAEPDERELVTWLVSHCKTSSDREGFVHELKRFAPVQIWGRCGKKLKVCPKLARLGCYRELSRRYKFYLSLENSLCKDYVTEKVYLALQAGMIPVVLGGADYSRFLPRGSYLDALNFSSVGELAARMNRIAEDRELFSSYFPWKHKWRVVERRYGWLCDLCTKLHSVDSEGRQKVDLLKWWFDDANCTGWKNGSLINVR